VGWGRGVGGVWVRLGEFGGFWGRGAWDQTVIE